MMRQALSFLLVLVLLIQASPVSSQDTATLRDRIQKTPLGTEIEVTLRSREMVTGTLDWVADGYFVLLIMPEEKMRRRRGLQPGSFVRRRIPYDEVVARTFAELQGDIKEGDIVSVTRSSGEVLKSKVKGFSSDGAMLSLEPRVRGRTLLERYDDESLDLREADIQMIELEIRDRLWDGPLYGFLIGLSVAGLWYATAETGDSAAAAASAMVIFSGVGAGVGFLADIARGRERQLVFSVEKKDSALQVNLSPILTKDRKGAVVSLSW